MHFLLQWINRSSESVIHIKKDKKLTMSGWNNDRYRLHWWSSTSCKSTSPRWILIEYLRTNWRYSPLCELNKVEFRCFKWDGAKSVNPLKSVEQFPYLSINISSTESDVNIHITKVWTAISSLSSYGHLIYLIK